MSLKFKELEKYKLGDLEDDKKREEILKIYPNLFEELRKCLDSIERHQIEKNIQPFKTNYLLEEIKKSFIPKWANWFLIGLTFLIFLLTIALLFK